MKTAFWMVSMVLASATMMACVGDSLEDPADDMNEAVAETEEALDSTLKLHLKFDEGSGTTLTNSGASGFSAAFRAGGQYAWAPATNPNCIMGGCLRLDGTANVNGISTNLGLNGAPTTGQSYDYARSFDSAMSYSVWIVLSAEQPASFYSKHQILSGDNGGYDWSLLFVHAPGQTNYKLAFFRSGGNIVESGSYILVPGVRYHLSVTFDPNSRTTIAYVNGVPALNAPVMANGITSYGVTIGENPSVPNEPMKGYIDDVRVYTRVLQESEITTVACDDGNALTRDVFVRDSSTGAGGCTHTPFCSTNADCNDDNTHTADTCVNNVCQHQQLQCIADSECADGNSCTVDHCVNNTCQHFLDEADGLSCGKEGGVCMCGYCCTSDLWCPPCQ